MRHKYYENMNHNLSLSKKDLRWKNVCADGEEEHKAAFLSWFQLG